MGLFRPSSEDVTVLLVCTGNICRSAVAERLGRAYLAEVRGSDAGRIRLGSAGTRAVVGSAMHPDSALVLQGFGGDAGDFRARQLDHRLVAAADLVLTMTRAHRHAVLQEAPRALARTFTLVEAADLLDRTAGDQARDGDDVRVRIQALVARMAAARAGRSSGDGDDIADPMGRPVEAHQAAGDAIVATLLPVLGGLAGPARTEPGGSAYDAVA